MVWGLSASSFNMSTDQKLQEKKQAIELQNKYLETRRLYSQVQTTIQLNEREKRKGVATQTELEQLPETTRVFKTIGRMFLLTSLSEVKTELSKQVSECEAEIKNLEARAEILEKQLRDYESQIREMLKQPQFAQYFT